jgi:hypothetical protein
MNDPNNLSGLVPQPYNRQAFPYLPIRSEKKIIPVPAPIPSGDMADLSVTAALQPFTQYVLLRIPGRGQTSNGTPDPSAAAYFQFLINPDQVSITKNTLDEQSFARGGWQIGVQGEDFTDISMEGKTPGKYFANGLTDRDSVFSMSYRNLTALELFFENNGYWFEGEQLFEGPLASGATYRQIKMHQDVQLLCGEFIWDGMFDNLQISEDADSPFLASLPGHFT